MLSAIPQCGRRRLAISLVLRALSLLVLASAQVTLSAAEPADPQKQDQSQAEAKAKYLREVLRRRVELKIGKAPLEDVLDEIATTYGIEIEQKYRDQKLGETPVTFNVRGNLWDFFRELQWDSFRKRQLGERIVCTLNGDRLVVEQLSEEDAAAIAWFDLRITGKWKDTPLETVLREISDKKHIDIRLDETVPETQRKEPITIEVKDLPLSQVCYRIFDPRGLVDQVKQGRILVRLWPIGSERWDPKMAVNLRELTHFEFIDVPLEKVLEKLAAQYHVKIALDLPKDTDIAPDTRITFSSDEVNGMRDHTIDTTLRGALYRLLVPLQLTVELRGDVLYVVEAIGE